MANYPLHEWCTRVTLGAPRKRHGSESVYVSHQALQELHAFGRERFSSSGRLKRSNVRDPTELVCRTD